MIPVPSRMAPTELPREPKRLTEPEPTRPERGHQRCRPARNGVDLREITEAIRLRKRDVVDEMQGQRHAEVGPGSELRQVNKEGNRQHDNAACRRDQTDGRQRFELDLEERIPSRMEGRSGQNRKENECIHA